MNKISRRASLPARAGSNTVKPLTMAINATVIANRLRTNCEYGGISVCKGCRNLSIELPSFRSLNNLLLYRYINFTLIFTHCLLMFLPIYLTNFVRLYSVHIYIPAIAVRNRSCSNTYLFEDSRRLGREARKYDEVAVPGTATSSQM